MFVQNKVRLKFKNEYVKAESPYRIIFCKVRRKDTERFEEALERLNNKMLLCGYRDYPEVCSGIAGMFEEGMKARESGEAVCNN